MVTATGEDELLVSMKATIEQTMPIKGLREKKLSQYEKVDMIRRQVLQIEHAADVHSKRIAANKVKQTEEVVQSRKFSQGVSLSNFGESPIKEAKEAVELDAQQKLMKAKMVELTSKIKLLDALVD